ncbi:threonine/serine ThrE exporter family protein [Oceanirhabdus sp. W0125-5]|uniref:threonine/serine ThrE exporter family protein n=1 Tax=Oceanirhabdus sp. W0125-5 TaxID=2999116 RepID=UPI0022F2AB4C|nr:threonine/serine exporter family protein [Oceanirhabdus sp. W0125-5]WBW99563.1 threonine/serine exporter family protein [Oceanirhabdus sp. W0125-5]
MSIKDILEVAETAGQIILENGGEVYRVEETIAIICKSYGVDIVESFVTPSVIMISLKDDKGNPTTFIKRIKKRTVDMNKIHNVNELSRKISSNSASLEYVKEELKKIKQGNKYKYPSHIIAGGAITGCFTGLFGGNYLEFILSFIIGCIITVLLKKCDKLQLNDFFTNILGGALATFIALFSSLFMNIESNVIIIGSIMLLVPGLTITNGIRDTIAGDFYSGISRVIEALFVAIGIVLGSVIIFSLFYYVKGVI